MRHTFHGIVTKSEVPPVLPLFSDLFRTNWFPERIAWHVCMVAYMPRFLGDHSGNQLVQNRIEIRCTGEPSTLYLAYLLEIMTEPLKERPLLLPLLFKVQSSTPVDQDDWGDGLTKKIKLGS